MADVIGLPPMLTTGAAMQEISPDIFHWSAIHPRTGGLAHSYLLAEAATVLDPMVPDDVFEELQERRPQRVVLTNRHHWRQSDRLVAELGCPVLCPEPGLHEFEGTAREVEPYRYGDQVAPGVIAHEVGAICPDDAALEIRVGDGFLAFADGLMRGEHGLRFVSDPLIGDDPEAVKRGLLRSLEQLLDSDFDGLLFAHGEPLVGGGKRALREFVDGRDLRRGGR
jgi:glyoxylase-like metal-dependent hydrolase (beta-lactamase superfamily II)